MLRWRMHVGICGSRCPFGLAGRCQGAAAFRRVRELCEVWNAGGGLVCAIGLRGMLWRCLACGVVPRRVALCGVVSLWRGVAWCGVAGCGAVWCGAE